MFDIFGLGSAISGIFNGITGAVNNKKNRDFQERTNKQNREWQLEDMARQEAREDTSYQRTVADMRKAGLSPTSLSGLDGSGAVPTVSAVAPQYTAPDFSGLTSALSGMAGNQLTRETNQQNESQFARGLKLSYEQLAQSTTDANEKNRLQAEANRIAEEEAKTRKSQADADKKAKEEEQYQSYQEQFTNLISTGTYNASKSNVGLNIVGTGGSTSTFDGTPWSHYGYDSGDVTNLANGRKKYGLLRIMYDGEVPVFVTVEETSKGEYKYYNPSRGTWAPYKPDNDNYKQLSKTKPKSSYQLNPDGSVTSNGSPVSPFN